MPASWTIVINVRCLWFFATTEWEDDSWKQTTSQLVTMLLSLLVQKNYVCVFLYTDMSLSLYRKKSGHTQVSKWKQQIEILCIYFYVAWQLEQPLAYLWLTWCRRYASWTYHPVTSSTTPVLDVLLPLCHNPPNDDRLLATRRTNQMTAAADSTNRYESAAIVF